MPNIAEYLTDLLRQKNKLVDNLNSKGVEADYNERLNTLVPKVLEIKGGADNLPELYPVNISLSDVTIITITDTSNGAFGDGYIVYANGVQLTKFKNSENTITINLLDQTFPSVSDYNINVSIYDEDGFRNSAMSNTILYRMPGYYILNSKEAYLQTDYETSKSIWAYDADIIKLI